MTLTRRSLLLSAGALAPSTAIASSGTGIPQTMIYLMNGAIGIKSAYGAVWYPVEEQAALGNYVDQKGRLKVDGLVNMGGNEVIGFTQPGSVFTNLLFAINADELPVNQMRVFTGGDDTGFEHVTVDIIPAGKTLTIVNNGQRQQLAKNVPALMMKTAIVGAAQTFVAWLPRYWTNTWQFFHLFENPTNMNPQTAGWVAKQFVQGQSPDGSEILTVFPMPNLDGTPFPLGPIYKPWGMTGSFSNPVLNFTIGAIPGQQTGGLQNVALDSVIFDPSRGATPSFVQQMTVNPDGTFRRPSLGAPNLISPYLVPIHLSGQFINPYLFGFGTNGGVQEINTGIDTLTIDPSFNTPSGFGTIQPFGGPGPADPFD